MNKPITQVEAYRIATERPFFCGHLFPQYQGNIAARIQKAVHDEGHRPVMPKPPAGGGKGYTQSREAYSQRGKSRLTDGVKS